MQDTTDLQAFNHYAYVRNNPLSLLDPSGFSWIGSIFKAIGNFFTSVFRAIEHAIKAMLIAAHSTTLRSPNPRSLNCANGR